MEKCIQKGHATLIHVYTAGVFHQTST